MITEKFLNGQRIQELWTAIKTALSGKQNILTAGDGLSKEGDTLSVDTPVCGVMTQEEYNALPEEQRNKGLYVIPGTGGGGSSGGSGGVTMDEVNAAIQDAVADIQTQEVYSEEEQRIGTWINGKPLYRKIMTVPNIQLTTSVSSATLEIPSEIDKLTRRSLTAEYSTSAGKRVSLQLPYIVNVGVLYYLQEYVALDDHLIYLNWKFSEDDLATFTILLEYTKTTDQPGVTT